MKIEATLQLTDSEIREAILLYVEAKTGAKAKLVGVNASPDGDEVSLSAKLSLEVKADQLAAKPVKKAGRPSKGDSQ